MTLAVPASALALPSGPGWAAFSQGDHRLQSPNHNARPRFSEEGLFYVEPMAIMGWSTDDVLAWSEDMEGYEPELFEINGPDDMTRFSDLLGALSPQNPTVLRRVAGMRLAPSFASTLQQRAPAQLNFLTAMRDSAARMNAGLAAIEAKESFRPNMQIGFNSAPLASGGSVVIQIQPGLRIASPWRFCGIVFPGVPIGMLGISAFTIDSMPVDSGAVTQTPAATIGAGIVGSLAQYDTRSPGANMLLPYLGEEFSKDSVWQFTISNTTTAGDVNAGSVACVGTFLYQGEPCTKPNQGIGRRQFVRRAAGMARRAG